jgi:hypothetical protein
VISGDARWCVIEGDCLDVLPELGCVGRLITDGPYGIGSYSQTDDDGPYVEALRLMQGCATRAFFGYAETLIDWILRLHWGAPDEWVTWYPSNAEAKAGARSTQVLPRLAEHVAIYGATPGVRDVRRERSAGGARLSRSVGAATKRWTPDKPLREDAQAGDVWTDASPGIAFNAPDRLHPNEKPVSLMAKLVRLTSVVDDIILDPFAGSGSTGVAALRNGRRAILVEKDPGHAAVARERMEAEGAGSTLAASRAGQGSLFGAPK